MLEDPYQITIDTKPAACRYTTLYIHLYAYVPLQDAVGDGGSTAILTALQSFLTRLQQIECHESLKELLVNNNIRIGHYIVAPCIYTYISLVNTALRQY